MAMQRRPIVVDRPVIALEELCETETPNILTPRVDMFEDKDELVVRAELPGIDKESLNIEISGTMLMLKADVEPDVPEDANYFICERCLDVFSRAITLPYHIDTETVKANLRNGLLEIRMSKSAEAKTKRVDVSDGTGW